MEAAAPQTPSSPPRVLVVDDNEANRESLSRRLARHGYATQMAEDGSSALALLDNEPFDLVLLDVMMPGMSGLEVLTQIRRTQSPAQLPVIMATAKDQSDDVVEAMKLGASDYITKPIDFPVALARVQTQISLVQSVRKVVELQQRLAQRNTELEAANQNLLDAAEQTRKQMELAAKVQKTFLPDAAVTVAGVKVAWAFQPCEQLAGDSLNVCALGPHHVGFYLLDVTGHGVAASLLSVAVARSLSPGPGSMLLAADGTPLPPQVVAQKLDERFPFNTATTQFFSMLYALLDLRTRELTYVSAGHPSPVYLRRTTPPTFLNGGGNTLIGLGVDVGADYHSHQLTLEPGERVVLYSDGATEASNPAGELFGDQRLLQSLAPMAAQPLADTISTLLAALEQWREDQPALDDVSLLAIEVE